MPLPRSITTSGRRLSPPPATTGRTTATAPTPAPTAVPPRASPPTPTAPLSCGWWTLRHGPAFTVSQNGTLRTYTGAYDTATLTGDLNTLRYLQDHGAQTIQFVTNGQTSSFAINDLLAQAAAARCSTSPTVGPKTPPCCWWRQTTANW